MTVTCFTGEMMTNNYKIDELRNIFIKYNVIGKSGRLNCQRDKYLNENSSLSIIYNKYVSAFRTEREAFYCLKHNITINDIPKCPLCGNISKFIGKRYNVTCENCNANAIPEKIEQSKSKLTPEKIEEAKRKQKATCLQKYGVETVNQFYNKETKEKYEEDCLKKYGVKNAGQTKEAKEKRKETCRKRYGVDCNFQLFNSSEKSKRVWEEQHDEIVQKQRKTCLGRYGVTNANKLKSVQSQRTQAKREYTAKFEKEHYCIRFCNVVSKYGQGWKKLLRDGEITVIEDDVQCGKYIPLSDIPKIERYNQTENVYSVSNGEREVREYVSSIINNNIIYNKRDIISDNDHIRELDIYIPDKNVAVEYNGIYWHSSKIVSNTYHVTKSKLCVEKGIRLIHIFEDEWKWRKEICKSIIASALGVYDNVYYARKCEVKVIDAKTYRDFVENNHVAGAINSKYKFGLFYNGELVQVIGIGKSRFTKDEYELHRMCTKLFSRVVGGFSKLLKFASIYIKSEDGSRANIKDFELISYVDLAKFNGKGYESSGFEYVATTKPSYFYVTPNSLIRKNRLQMQKKSLHKQLKYFDENLTEQDNVVRNGYFCLYDCGTKKYKLTL